MNGVADLEIGLYRWDDTHYAVDLRYEGQGGAASGLPLETPSTPLKFNFATLKSLAEAEETEQYGELLFKQLFADPAVLKTFDVNIDSKTAAGVRIRLYISPYAPELHDLRWETLRDDRPPKRWLATDPMIRFSRYLIGTGGRPIPAAPQNRSQLRALVAIAAPSMSLASWTSGGKLLDPIVVDAERTLAVQALQDLGIANPAQLASDLKRPVTLNNLIGELEKGIDILYLVCHGAVLGQPLLWLESDTGETAVVLASALTSRLRDLVFKPRLVVLASCQSAGIGAGAPVADDQGSSGTLATLGPLLVAAGIPAVLAMQGNISQETVKLFMPAFFEALRDKNGLIDEAVATARDKLQTPSKPGRTVPRPDWWVPVLFTRLKSGNLWGGTGIPINNQAFDWKTLITKLRAGRCTAFLGSGMLDNLIGSTREIARRLAEANRFALAPQNRDDLPQVAQFLKIARDDDVPYLELNDYLKRQLRSRYKDALRHLDSDTELDDMIVRAGLGFEQQTGQPEVHSLLARLPFPLFVSTNPDSLMEQTLAKTTTSKGQLKIPQVRTFVPTQLPPTLDKGPSEATPLVYYLFGRLQSHQKDQNFVLTEDDYFDYLINVQSAREKIPTDVREALVNTSLVFLGFRLDEWDFRILARSIRALGGSYLQNRKFHVAVQVAPGEQFLDRENAAKYLARQFQFGAQPLSIYVGTTEQFLTELWSKYQANLTLYPD